MGTRQRRIAEAPAFDDLSVPSTRRDGKFVAANPRGWK